ncbi:acyltransferase family protein [Lacrimispora amygdalina]|uniref:acyltransferase family protein n=1 Tax=Lacrimispora amygdalina TaxID=253257 RepID=UPI000BE2C246
MNRLRWLDALKGIGIILIMVSHSFVIPYLGRVLNACFIPLFFISTGYTYSKKGIKKYLTDKINRLLIPYFFYGIVLVILLAVFKYMRSGNILNNTLFGMISLLYSRYCLYPRTANENIRFLANEVSPLWYLTAAFVTSIIFEFIPKSNRKQILFSCIICITITIWMSFLPVLLPWSLDTAFLGTVFMLFGLLIRRINLENLNQKKLVIYCIVIIYILLAYFNPGINISVREYGKYGVLSIVLTIMSDGELQSGITAN